MNYTKNKNYFNSKFKNKIDSLESDFVKKWFESEIFKKYNEIEKEYLKQKNSYASISKSHGLKILLWLFIILITLGIALVWIKPKWSKSSNQKQNAKKSFNEKVKEKIRIHKEISLSYEFDRHFEKLESLLEYKKIGPITNDIVKMLNGYSIFDLKINNETNPWNSSWGIVKKNKIIISASSQNHVKTVKTYSGSITIGAGKSRRTIYAHYQHPAYSVEIQDKKYMFMKDCSNLEFSFKKQHYFKKFFKNDNRLENKEFDNQFSWNRNDEVQFRMIFTPLMQERYLNEFYANNSNVLDEDKYFKIKTFLSNDYIGTSNTWLYNSVKKIMIDFVNEPDRTLNDLLSSYMSIVSKNIEYEYKNMKYAYAIPFIQSVNDNVIIQRILDLKREYEPGNIFYILSQIIKTDLYRVDVDPFYKLKETNIIDDISISTIEVLTYKIVNKTIYIFESGYEVPVDYDDYIPKKLFLNIYYTFINNFDDFYRPLTIGEYIEEPKFKDAKILESIINYEANSSIKTYIQDGYLVALDYSGNENVKEIFDYINKIKKMY